MKSKNLTNRFFEIPKLCETVSKLEMLTSNVPGSALIRTGLKFGTRENLS